MALSKLHQSGNHTPPSQLDRGSQHLNFFLPYGCAPRCAGPFRRTEIEFSRMNFPWGRKANSKGKQSEAFGLQEVPLHFALGWLIGGYSRPCTYAPFKQRRL